MSPPHSLTPPESLTLMELCLLIFNNVISNLLEPKSIMRKYSELSNLFFEI